MKTAKLMEYRQVCLTALFAVFVLILSLPRPAKSVAGNSAAAQALIREQFGKLPLSFEANRGQTDSRVKFLSRGNGYSFFLTPTEAVMELRRAESESRVETLMGNAQNSLDPQSRLRAPQSATLRMTLIGANQNPRLTGAQRLPGPTHYLLGDDPNRWRTNVPNFARVKYEGVYPGIDAVYYGNQQRLEYDFIVAPGADPKVIKLHFAGADKLRLDETGDLILETNAGEVRQSRPVLYQEIGGERKPVFGRYTLRNQTVGFEIGDYDRSRTLVIDPLLNYSTILGKSSLPRAVAVDAQGNAYVCGYLQGLTNFPLTAGALQIATDSSAFVMKFSANSMNLVYSAIFGGTTPVQGRRGPLLQHRVNGAFAVDAAGNAYVAGTTSSGNFPTTPGAYQRTYTASEQNSFSSGFLVKLNSAGDSFGYATLFSGASPVAIAVDSAGQAYVTGSTEVFDFPTTPDAFQKTLDNPYPSQSVSDAFITKFSADGSRLVYSTYFGGGGKEEAMSIALDAAGNIYLAGATSNGVIGGGNPDGNPFPTTPGAFKGIYDHAIKGGGAFVTKLNAAGTALIYSTVLPGGNGAGLDQANVLLPRSLSGRGEVDLVLNVDGKAANPVKVWIK